MSDIRFDGLNDVLESIDSIADETKVKAALGKACALVERDAKQNAPKGNGELRRSITSTIDGLEGIVFTPLEYAPYVEFGTGLFAEGGNGRQDVPWAYQDDKGEWHKTSGMKPHPYLRPALYKNKQKIIKIIGDSLKDD